MPPLDTLGNTSTDFVGVGAHQAHAGPSTWHAEIACTECHVVPEGVTDPGHNDSDLPAELTWGPLASADGAVPAWDGATCAVYCHGATLPDGGADPDWTVVDGTYATCTACHGLPPAAPHPPRSDCHTCHPGIDAAQVITDAAAHIDGVLQVLPLNCMSCHGSGDDPAPPLDTAGHTGTTFTGVGAHQAHQGPSTWHTEITCDACHLVPAATDDPGHIDTALPAELIWGPLAVADGANASWNGTTCAVYCHGSTLPDGGADPPWTVVDGTYATCEACHGLPPAAPHSDLPDCYLCHPGLDAELAFTEPGLHIDGQVQLDETVPSVPTNFVLGAGGLTWDTHPDADFLAFNLYGSDQAVLDAAADLIDQTAGTTYDVTAHPFPYYHLTAVDYVGNESAAATADALTPTPDLPPSGRNALLEAAPNPFNPVTRLRFDLAAPGHARLTVYDAAGRLVKVLTDGPRSAGRHSVVWDGRTQQGDQAASGVYLYRLEADGFRETKRMTLVK